MRIQYWWSRWGSSSPGSSGVDTREMVGSVVEILPERLVAPPVEAPFQELWALQDLNLRPIDYESTALTN